MLNIFWNLLTKIESNLFSVEPHNNKFLITVSRVIYLTELQPYLAFFCFLCFHLANRTTPIVIFPFIENRFNFVKKNLTKLINQCFVFHRNRQDTTLWILEMNPLIYLWVTLRLLTLLTKDYYHANFFFLNLFIINNWMKKWWW